MLNDGNVILYYNNTPQSFTTITSNVSATKMCMQNYDNLVIYDINVIYTNGIGLNSESIK